MKNRQEKTDENFSIFVCIEKAYKDCDADEKIAFLAEDILGFSINYFKDLLENPAIWGEDFYNTDQTNTDDAAKLEKFITENIFKKENIENMV